MRRVGRDQAAVWQCLDARLVAQATLVPVLDRPRCNELPRGVELLDARVACFRHVDRPVRANRDSRWLVELPRLLAAPPEVAKVRPVWSVPADAVGARIGYQDVALVVNRDPPRPPELVRRGVDEIAGRLSPNQDRCQVRAEFLDPVVPCVGYINVPGGVDRDIGRLVELAGRRARRAHYR